jgi:hypothetical protein
MASERVGQETFFNSNQVSLRYRTTALSRCLLAALDFATDPTLLVHASYT